MRARAEVTRQTFRRWGKVYAFGEAYPTDSHASDLLGAEFDAISLYPDGEVRRS
jgi:hypothetical protein